MCVCELSVFVCTRIKYVFMYVHTPMYVLFSHVCISVHTCLRACICAYVILIKSLYVHVCACLYVRVCVHECVVCASILVRLYAAKCLFASARKFKQYEYAHSIN